MASPSQDEGLGPDERGGRTQKAPGAFRTISEVSGEIDVPQHVLRFWESKFAQVKPLKRAGGRRYYRPEDVALLGRIRSLLYEEGYTIKGVQKLMRSGGVKALDQAHETRPRSGGARQPDAHARTPAAALKSQPDKAMRWRADLKVLRRELVNLRDILRDKSKG